MQEVRRAGFGDIPRLVEMGEKFYETAEWPASMPFNMDYLLKWLNAVLAGDEVAIFVNKEVTAMCGVGVQPSYFTGVDVACELFWWVDEKERNNGTGKALWSAMETWAYQHGAKAMVMAALNKPDLPVVDMIYRNAGYRKSELSYVKEL